MPALQRRGLVRTAYQHQHFRDNLFANPAGLLEYIQEEGPAAKVRPDMRVVFFDDWETPEQRLKGTTHILRTLVAIAEKKKAA